MLSLFRLTIIIGIGFVCRADPVISVEACSKTGVCKPGNDSRHYLLCASGCFQRMEAGSFACINGEVRPASIVGGTTTTKVSFSSPTLQTVGDTTSVPTSVSTQTARPIKNILSGKRLVTYINTWSIWTRLPTPQEMGNYNVINLAFYLTSGPTDFAEVWQRLPEGEKISIINAYHDAHKVLMLSVFGSGDTPTTKDAVEVAKNISDFVNLSRLDGVDIDYEDLACFNQHPDICIDWLVKLVKTLHTTLHSPLITISPLAPWYSPRVYDCAFLKLNDKVGDMISWFNIQYYNQGNCSVPVAKFATS